MESKSEPINIAPGSIFRDDAGQKTSYEEAEEEARGYDREGGCTPMHRGEVAHEGKHCIAVNQGSLAERKIVYVLNCGVTVVKAVRNERKQNTGNESVMHSPILEPKSSISTTSTRI